MPLAHISLPTVMSQEEEDRRLIADKSTKESLGIADTFVLDFGLDVLSAQGPTAPTGEVIFGGETMRFCPRQPKLICSWQCCPECLDTRFR